MTKKQTRGLLRILLTAAVFALTVALRVWVMQDAAWYWSLCLFLIPYLLIGWDVLWDAVWGLLRGQWLDEKFLMTIATVGALAVGEYPEAVFVMLFYQLGEWFQALAVGRSRRSIAALMELRPDEARVLRDGREQLLSPDEVEVGELLFIRPGERIPLDGVIVEGRSELDTLSLTGEAIPREVREGDEILSGCVNLTGAITVRVTKPSEESTVSKILSLVEESTLAKSKTERVITRFARYYTPAVVLSAVLLAVIPSLITGNWREWIYSSLIFLVVSCPCALVISVPLTYFSGLGKASRNGILIKGAGYLEVLADLEVVVFDKTGTLTMGDFSVSEVTPTEGDASSLLALAAAAEQTSNHPIALSLLRAAEGLSLPPVLRSEELPGSGVHAWVDGREVFVGNRRWMEELSIPYPEQDGEGTALYVASEGRCLGVIRITDRIKETAKKALDDLKRSGVTRTVMLSGDRLSSARAVADQLGIHDVRAELLPSQKVACLEECLKETKRGRLAYVGDGVNDAPVLARADIGIAMGALGSDAAIEAADTVLMDDDPRRIALAVRIARRTKRIVWQNILFALSVKVGFLLLAALGLTNMWAATFADVGVAVLAILNATRAGR